MGKYAFITSKVVENYCDKIVEEMITRFQITNEEALDRVNQKWGHIVAITDENDLIFHLTPDEWAYDIYFGPNSKWWKKNPEELKPLPYTPSKGENNS